MVKQISILLLTIASFSACAKHDSMLNQQSSMEYYNSNQVKNIQLNKDERTIFYKGNYYINYKEPRTVWFKPLLTEKGNIVSERTITLAPKDLKWSSEHYMQTGDKFNELLKDNR